MDQPHHKRNRALLLLAAIFALAVGLISAVLWASEPWQRPLSLLRFADGIWLAIAIAGFGASAVIWPAFGTRRHWAWRAVGGIALSAFILPTALHVRCSAAVAALLDHDEVSVSSRPDPQPSRLDVIKKFWREEILHFFEVQQTYPPSGGRDEIISPDAYDHLLETCRWPTRRAFLSEILADESRVRLATHHWHRMFPAVIGQDVSLSHRSELLEWLDVRAADKSAPAACRDAAAFWMALIVLTDAEVFASWGERTLSHMLASENPPVSTAHLMWMRPSGDVWMRSLDLLLAMTPEEQHSELTAPLARDSALLRRAARQRVRGMQHHADAIMREIETLDQESRHVTAAATWLDLKRVADQFARGDLADEIQAWLASTMEGWLMEDSAAVSARFSPYVKPTLSHMSLNTVEENFVLPLPSESADRLAARAHATLDMLVELEPGGKTELSKELEHAMIIAAFLAVGERAVIYNRVAVLISKWIPHFAASGGKGQTYKISGAINTVMNHLDEEKREALKQLRLKWCAFDHRDFSQWHALPGTGVAVERASQQRELSGAERVALTTHRNQWFMSHEPHSAEDVEDFLAVLTKKEEPVRMRAAFRHPRRLFEQARLKPDAWPQDELRFHAYRTGLIGAEHLPEDWLGFVRNRGIDTLRNLLPDREVWEPLSRDPGLVKELLEYPDFVNSRGYSAFLDYLESHSSDADARDLLMNHLSRLADSQDRMERINAFKILLRFSNWLGSEERSDFRERLHLFFRQDRPGLEHWVGLHTRNDGREWWIEARNHRGEWVPWEDDALSAAFSWSSQIHHELASLPSKPDDKTGVFRHLYASGSYFDLSEWGTPEFYQIDIDVIAPTSVFSDPVPSPPFAATAWQRARDLHLRRPDLKFPTRPIFRPSGERVRLQEEIKRIDL